MTVFQAAAEQLRPDDRAIGLLIGENVEIDPSAEIGANVVIYANTVVAANAVIKHNVVLGGAPTLHKNSRSQRLPFGVTTVGAGVTICNNAIVMAGVVIGESTVIGDAAYVRERVVFGEDCVIARGCGVGAGSQIGDRVNMQTLSLLTPGALLEDDVFIGPGVTFTSDVTIARQDGDVRTQHVLRRGCRIGGGTTLTPSLEIGEEAFVAAGSVVTRDIDARDKVRGVPARSFGSVSDEELLERWR